MPDRAFFRKVFLVAAVYDLTLGAAFFFLHPLVYALLGIPAPTEPAYLHAAAAFVFVQGIMYLFVHRDMERNRDMVFVGAIYKGAYTGVAFYHASTGTLPHGIFTLFGVADLAFLVLFVLALLELRGGPGEPPAERAPGVPTPQP